MKEWCFFENSVASVVEKKIDFAGRIWKPTRQIAFVKASLCHPLPVVNSKRRGFTASTLANSFSSAVMQLFDVEHRLEFYGAKQDAICGAIAAAEYPAKKKANELAAEGKMVPVEVLVAMWRKAAGADKMLEEMASEENPWRVSGEWEWPTNDSALWDGEKFYAWDKASDEMKKLVKPNDVADWDGKKMTLVCGGEDGFVNFSGGGFTKRPADKNAGIEQMAASGKLMINVGWESNEDWLEAAASAEPEEKKSDTAAALIIGKTAPAEDGHTHDIARDLTVLPAMGHSHYFKPNSFDPETGVLDGICSSMWLTDASGKYMEHTHTVAMGGSQSTEQATIKVPELTSEEVPMHEKQIKFLREQANEIRTKDPVAAKKWDDQASALEKDQVGQDTAKQVEETVTARIQSGDLIPKAKHDEAVAAAEKKGKESAEKAAQDKAAEDKRVSEVRASRAKALEDAKIDPKFVLSKDKTIEAVVASMPCTPEGDKQFAERLEEWVEWSKKTGQAKASQSTASAAENKGAPLIAGSEGSAAGDKKKPAIAFV